MYEDLAVQYQAFTQYTGANGASIFDAASNGQSGTWSYTEVDGVLTIKQDFGDDVFDEWSAPENGYFLWRSDGTLAVGLSESDFNDNMVKLVDMMNDAVTSTSGVANVGTVGANDTVSVSVTLAEAFADTNYTVVGQIIGGQSLLGKLEVVSTTVVDESHVNVSVHNTDLLLSVSGGKVLVTAVK